VAPALWSTQSLKLLWSFLTNLKLKALVSHHLPHPTYPLTHPSVRRLSRLFRCHPVSYVILERLLEVNKGALISGHAALAEASWAPPPVAVAKVPEAGLDQ
jgi:hypothetical protein